jgi:preprotein translocase subunit Sec63
MGAMGTLFICRGFDPFEILKVAKTASTQSQVSKALD